MGQSNIEKYFSRLEEVFLELVRTLHSELANQMVSGITGSQFFVLKKINERGRMTVSEVAEELGVSLSAITALVNRMVNNGLAVRTRDLTDRRLVWLEATEQGADVMRRCLEGRRKVAEKYFGQIPEEDMEKLIEIYEKVLTILRSEKTENAARNRNHPQ
ncbi:MAG TPA: MarR family transcriptional regulator [Bacillota bacterium]|jgi:DNA-binding MarR family transcriptional regulator|nr:MarR family transcriptional regulator [Peptococcaceae bacterium]HPZ43171.1 MarR family transcriptional regulator [Bacillota bacterium]HQD75728.1 MarR family transcriptional regulator [Bacillota bacterium]HUM58585.1 MarR family transcriptional regulator [Bacillota bacterium]